MGEGAKQGVIELAVMALLAYAVWRVYPQLKRDGGDSGSTVELSSRPDVVATTD